MKFFHTIHPSYMILLFAIGIIAGSIISMIIRPTVFSSSLWLVVALILLLFSLFFSKLLTTPLALVAGILIIFSRAAPVFVSQDLLSRYVGQEVVLSGTVAKDPDNNSSGAINLTLDHLGFADESIPPGIKAFVQVSNGQLKKTDRVSVKGELSSQFGAYSAVIYRAKLINVERQSPEDVFLKFRDFFAAKIKAHLPSPQNGIAIGYLLGQKTGVDLTFVEALSIVGLTHIIVASGAHLSILTGLAKKTVGRLSRFACIFSSILVTIIFISITGLSASMLRAGLVTSISLILWYFGRNISPIRLITLVAALTLIINPFYVSDLAWLLSFAAFTGILVFSPSIGSFLYDKDKTPGLISSTLITSFSAALLCSPILLFYFGQISLFSIFANLLVLPTISVVMGLAALTGILAITIPPLADFVGVICKFVIDYQIAVVNFFKELDFSVIRLEKNNALVFLLYLPIIVVIFTTVVIKKKKSQKIKR